MQDTESAAITLNEDIESPLFNCCNHDDYLLSEQFTQDSVDDEDFPLNPPSDEPIVPIGRNEFQIVDLDQVREEDFMDVGKSTTKTPAEASRIQSVIQAVALFLGYDEDELKVVTDYMFLRTVKSGDVVIRQGAAGDAFYVVKSGKFSCTVPHESGGENTIRLYEDSGYFGELALINRAPRAATVTALTDGELWCLCALRCVWLRRRQAILNAERFEQVLKAIPLFKENMEPEHLNRLIDAIETLNLPNGHVICRQGDPGDAMYFVLEGEVDISINGTLVKTLKKNEFFGERALVLDEGRAATCTIAVPSKIAKLPQESFSLLIPDNVIDQMRRHISVSYRRKSSKTDDNRDDGNDDELSANSGVYVEYVFEDQRK